MKRLVYIVFFFVFVCSSCTDDFNNLSNISSCDHVTRALNPENSPYYPWEDTAYIKLKDISGNIVLPWYGGASTSIPVDVLKDYKHRDGWNLVYNFCTPTASGKITANKYYLIFYNVFSGQLRCFVYVNENVSNGNDTFWQLSFNGTSKLCNDFDSIVYANDITPQLTSNLVNNLTRTPVKSLSKGWNCFDMDLSVYDPSLESQDLSMNIDLYNSDKTSLNGIGNVLLKTNGDIVSSTSSNSTPNFNGTISHVSSVGSNAVSKLLHIGSSTIKSGIAGAIKEGLHFLTTKLFAKKTVTNDSSIVKLTSTGTIKLNGELMSNSQANIAGLSQLMVPGSKESSNYVLIPSYNKPLGVWYLKKTPTIKLLSKDIFFVETKDDNGIPPVHGSGSDGKIMYVYGVFTIGLADSLNIELNPVVKSLISHYSVSTAIIGDVHNLQPTTDENGMILGLLWAKIYGNTFVYNYDDSSALMMYRSKYPSTVYVPNKEVTEYYQKFQQILKAQMPSNIGLRVAITLYPKEPYNTTPVVIVRTIKCNVESEN